MFRMKTLRCPRTFLALFALTAAFAFARAAESGRALFNGRDFTGWDMFMATPDPTWDVPGLKRDASGKYLEPIGTNRDPLKVFNVEKVDGEPAIHITGQGFGVITTRESFENFYLRLEVKWGERKWGMKLNSARDSGLLYFVHGPPGFDHGTWPRSIEFQIQEHDMGDLYALGTQISVNARAEGRLWLYDPKGAPTLFVQRAPIGNRCVKRGDPERPNGEWNVLELVCFNGDSIHIVNGQVVMRLQHAQRLDHSAPADLRSGHLSLQTEGAEVYFRRIEVRPLDAVPAAFAQRD
jgi:hypothetical protein